MVSVAAVVDHRGVVGARGCNQLIVAGEHPGPGGVSADPEVDREPPRVEHRCHPPGVVVDTAEPIDLRSENERAPCHASCSIERLLPRPSRCRRLGPHSNFCLGFGQERLQRGSV